MTHELLKDVDMDAIRKQSHAEVDKLFDNYHRIKADLENLAPNCQTIKVCSMNS